MMEGLTKNRLRTMIDTSNVGGHSDSKGGRPSLFTEEREAKIIDAIRRGLTYKGAAAYAGISYSTFHRWKTDGKSDFNLGVESVLCEFWKALQEANGEAQLRFVSNIGDSAGKGDWRAAAWMLERRFPDVWGKDAEPESDLDFLA